MRHSGLDSGRHGHGQGHERARNLRLRRLRARWGRRFAERSEEIEYPRVLLVGSPNVGKSVLFHRLTGVYVTVSNYPGTTVEISRGHMRLAGREIEVVDTPGMYSLRPIGEDERVSLDILLREQADVIVHVMDAKNLSRMLSLTLELMETGIPLIAVANMADEARRYGISINGQLIEERLGAPFLMMSAIEGTGVDDLRNTICGMIGGHATS